MPRATLGFLVVHVMCTFHARNFAISACTSVIYTRNPAGGVLQIGERDCGSQELSLEVSRRQRVCLAVLRGAGWNRAAAEMRVRLAAAAALEGAAAEVRHGARDDRVRALLDRALRRLSLVADLAVEEEEQSRRSH